MKYFSEKLDKLFDSVEDLQAAENQWELQKQNAKKKEEEARKELEEIHLAIAHLKDLLIKYNEKHGPMSSMEFLSEVAERLWQ